MPYSPQSHQQLLDLLYRQRQLPLTDVIALFASNDGKPDLRETEYVINALRRGNSLSVREGEGAEFTGFNPRHLKAPEGVTLVLANPADLEADTGASFQREPMPADWDGDEPNERFVYWQDKIAMRLIGDVDEAPALAQRMLAFVQYFACHLVARRFDRVAELFSRALTSKFTAESLNQQLRQLEADWGALEHFTNVELQTLYCGTDAGTKLFTEMKLPKGIKREQRRGEASFQLAGLHTPSGVPLTTCNVYLAVVEEDGMLKVCDVRWGE